LRIKYIAPSKTRGDAVSEDDLETALQSAAHEPVMLAWFTLAAYAGCGPKEIAFMHRADVHDKAKPPFLTVRGRGDRERVVTNLDHRVVLAVQHVEEWWVGLTPQHVSIAANRFLHDRSQLKHVSISQLRNRFIVESIAINEDVFEAQRQIGHTDPKSTLVYSRQESPTRGAVRRELR
jgi:integrase